MKVYYLKDQKLNYPDKTEEILFKGPFLLNTDTFTGNNIVTKKWLESEILKMTTNSFKTKIPDHKFIAFNGDLVNKSGENNFKMKEVVKPGTYSRLDVDQSGRVIGGESKKLKLDDGNIVSIDFNKLDRKGQGSSVLDYTKDLVTEQYLFKNKPNVINKPLKINKQGLKGDFVLNEDDVEKHKSGLLVGNVDGVKLNGFDKLGVSNIVLKDYNDVNMTPWKLQRNFCNKSPSLNDTGELVTHMNSIDDFPFWGCVYYNNRMIFYRSGPIKDFCIRSYSLDSNHFINLNDYKEYKVHSGYNDSNGNNGIFENRIYLIEGKLYYYSYNGPTEAVIETTVNDDGSLTNIVTKGNNAKYYLSRMLAQFKSMSLDGSATVTDIFRKSATVRYTGDSFIPRYKGWVANDIVYTIGDNLYHTSPSDVGFDPETYMIKHTNGYLIGEWKRLYHVTETNSTGADVISDRYNVTYVFYSGLNKRIVLSRFPIDQRDGTLGSRNGLKIFNVSYNWGVSKLYVCCTGKRLYINHSGRLFSVKYETGYISTLKKEGETNYRPSF